MKQLIAVLLGLFLAFGILGSPEPPADAEAKGAVVRILTPPGAELRGRSEVETLAIDPEIRQIVVFVDGEEAARRGHPPWNVKVALADPPREQTIEVKAFGARDRELGSDRVVVNRRPVPFRVRITSLRSGQDGSFQVEADVSVPHDAVLDAVDFYLGDRRIVTLSSPPFTATIPAGAGSFVRAVATLRDGRTSEDVDDRGQKITVRVKDRKDVEVRAVFGWDQVS